VVAHDCGPRQLAAFYCLEFRPLLDSGASCTTGLQCATVCHQPCAKTCHWLHLRQNWKRIFSGVYNDSRRPPDAVVRSFSRFRRRDISDFTYLLTYHLRSSSPVIFDFREVAMASCRLACCSDFSATASSQPACGLS